MKQQRPELNDDQVDAMVATASTMGLGWAVFGDHLCASLGVSDEQRSALDQKVTELVAELGGIPAEESGFAD